MYIYIHIYIYTVDIDKHYMYIYVRLGHFQISRGNLPAETWTKSCVQDPRSHRTGDEVGGWAMAKHRCFVGHGSLLITLLRVIPTITFQDVYMDIYSI